jgi:hypothetical protein
MGSAFKGHSVRLAKGGTMEYGKEEEATLKISAPESTSGVTTTSTLTQEQMLHQILKHLQGMKS